MKIFQYENLYHIYLLNCRSKLFPEKNLHLSSILQSRRPDVFCLTETWWDESFPHNISLAAAYSIIATAECRSNQCRGVAI